MCATDIEVILEQVNELFPETFEKKGNMQWLVMDQIHSALYQENVVQISKYS